MLILTENVELVPKFQLVEYFSGRAAVSTAFKAAGKAVFSFDIVYSRSMDILQPAGFALLECILSGHAKLHMHALNKNKFLISSLHIRCAATAALCSTPGALHVYAPVCSSWTQVSSATHCRNEMNMFGNTSYAFVRDGTMMVSRSFS